MTLFLNVFSLCFQEFSFSEIFLPLNNKDCTTSKHDTVYYIVLYSRDVSTQEPRLTMLVWFTPLEAPPEQRQQVSSIEIFILIFQKYILLSALCGYNTGYHVYLEMGAVGTSPSTKAYIKFDLDSANWKSYNRRWNILASQIECDRDYHAPQVRLE